MSEEEVSPGSDESVLLPHVEIFVAHARRDVHAERFWDARESRWAYKPVHQPVDTERLRRHLEGGPYLGVYFIPAGTNITRIAALDLDDHEGTFDANRMREVAKGLRDIGKKLGLDAWPVRSGGGSGVHLLYRWDADQPADAVRDLLLTLIAAAGLKEGTGGVDKGEVEIFPKQCEVPAGGFGSLLAVPFGRKSVPLDADLNSTSVPMSWISSTPVPSLQPKQANPPVSNADPGAVREALKTLAADDYLEWIKIGLALKNSLGDAGFALWDDWSQRSEKYQGQEVTKKRWDAFRPREGGVTVGTVFHLAREAGWQGEISRAAGTPNGIVMRPGELNSILDDAEDALLADGAPIYQRGVLVRLSTVNRAKAKKGSIEIDRAEGSTILTPVSDRWLLQKMAQSVSWNKVRKDGEAYPADPLLDYARHLLARAGDWPFPVLRGLLSAPTLDRDGRIIQQPGYDVTSGLYLDFSAGIFPNIPEHPTREDAVVSMKKLKHLLRGFPFENGVALSVALSAILTSLIRPSIKTAPIHAFDAPAAGSGKSMLVEVTAIIATGNTPAAMSQGKDDEEDEKRLSVALQAGDSIIWIDNCERPLQGDFLCSMITQETVQTRILGKSERVILPSSTLVMATGNNLVVAGDTTRRVVICRLDAGVERPDTREFDFDCREEARSNRPELVVAALTALRAYRISGARMDLPPMGSFLEWEWVRGTLVWAGYSDPAKSRDDIVSSDPKTDVLAEVMEAWDAVYQDSPVRVKALDVGVCEGPEDRKARLMRTLIDATGRNRWNSRAVAAYLKRNRGRIVGERRFNSKESGGRAQWRLERIKKPKLTEQKSLGGI